MTIHPKSRKRRRPKRPSCEVRGCRRRILVMGLCRPHIEKECDHLFSLLIRHRDKRCMNCRRRLPIAELQCSHHLRRALHFVRYDVENACAHCAACHVRFTHAPELHHDWIVTTYGQQRWDDLMDKAYGPIVNGRRQDRGTFGAEEFEKVLTWLRYGAEEVA